MNPSQNIITFLAGDDNFARGELVPTDDWMHVAVVFQDTVATIYVNGVDATFDYNINPVSSDEVPLWIGNLTGSADDPEGGAFNGHIDEIGILDIALTGDEVRNIIANGFEINSNVAAYWDFGSGSGVQLVDQSSNANNGAITGAAWAIDSPNQSPMDENSFSQLCTATGGEYSENSCVISVVDSKICACFVSDGEVLLVLPIDIGKNKFDEEENQSKKRRGRRRRHSHKTERYKRRSCRW